jgi:Zn2+/Cd2+-exporting ATPase
VKPIQSGIIVKKGASGTPRGAHRKTVQVMTKETFSILGLDCADCARTLEKGVAELPGVVSSHVSFALGRLEVEYEEHTADHALIRGRARELGYELVDGTASAAPPANLSARSAAADELLFEVEDLDCADCALHLEQALAQLPGVSEVKLDFMAARLRVIVKDGADVKPKLEARARQMGHTLHLQEAAAAPTPQSWRTFAAAHRREATTALSGLALTLGAAGEWLGAPAPVSTVLFAAAIVIGGYDVARAAWTGVRTTRSLDMNVLMTLAAIGAMAIGQWLEGAMVMFLFSLGNTLEGYTINRARNAIRTLVDLSPREAIRVHGDHVERVPVGELAVGELILIRPGDRIPMDGVIESGSSAVNQAPVTGEALPVDRTVGDTIYAGTVNGRGVLSVRVSRLAADNTIARIIRLVEQAQAQRAPSQRFVDVFARYYTPIIVGVAVGVAVIPPVLHLGEWLTWIYRALVLLVIGCPCALVISTPVTIVSAIASAARAGVLIKGGAYLEKLGGITAVAFDKTGTLTRGEPEVIDARCARHAQTPTTQDCSMCSIMLSNAAAIESRSEHPLAQAVVREAERRGLNWSGDAVEDVEALAGKGVRGRINGQAVSVGSHKFSHETIDAAPHDEVLCDAVEAAQSAGGTVMVVDCSSCGVQGYIAVADTVREDAREAIAELKRIGVKHIVMLTGDNAATAEAIGGQVGVDEFRADLLPEDKVRAVEEIMAQYGKVAMVGDGINDAPALARATLGIAMGAAGSATALETADVALMGDNLGRLPFAIGLGRQTMRIIKQNIVFALALKALFLALAIAGSATLWMAVFADVGASMIVILNGMRLLRARPNQ